MYHCKIICLKIIMLVLYCSMTRTRILMIFFFLLWRWCFVCELCQVMLGYLSLCRSLLLMRDAISTPACLLCSCCGIERWRRAVDANDWCRERRLQSENKCPAPQNSSPAGSSTPTWPPPWSEAWQSITIKCTSIVLTSVKSINLLLTSPQ